ncbi:MAG: metal-dependent transcriptional regulator [Clostridia bacterium]|nr:metal-dependent transcriptional regulator [Clostridia bacterium]
MKTGESEEMYLETILVLKKNNPCVHAVDVAAALNYSRPSVSRGVNLLKTKGYIEVSESGEIVLTEAGEKKAADIWERHGVITELLVKMGADLPLAEENACRIEHVISPQLFDVMKEYLKDSRKK